MNGLCLDKANCVHIFSMYAFDKATNGKTEQLIFI